MKLCYLQEVDGTGNHHVKWSKPDWEGQILHCSLSHAESRPKKIGLKFKTQDCLEIAWQPMWMEGWKERVSGVNTHVWK
jgi:hypothetical protein